MTTVVSTSEDGAHASVVHGSGQATALGETSHAMAAGWSGKASASGVRGHAMTSGNYSNALAAGEHGNAASTGYYCRASATGESGHAMTSGESSHATAAGVHGNAMAARYFSRVSAGRGGTAASLGLSGKAMAGPSGSLILTYLDCDNRRRHAVGYVGENGIEAGVWYQCDESGELVPVAEGK